MSDSLAQNLSRLALAKAIKTPYEDDTDAEHWSKSIIFCQPFVEEMEAKALSSNSKHIQYRDKRPISKQQAKPQHHHQQQQNRRPQVQYNKQPKDSHNPIPKQYKNKSRSHLPSDSDDSETSDKKPVSRPNSCPATEPPMPLRPKGRSISYEDRTRTKKSMSHSRASSSSSATPLTEDDQAPEDYFRKHPLKHIPSDDKDPYYNRRSMKEIDLYYQQLYQQQLQFQLALQQQQQQMYYAQPIYLPAPRVEENKRYSSRHHHHHHRPTNTDLRRRAEMMRTSNDTKRHSHGQYGYYI